jgi:hypothetical protein
LQGAAKSPVRNGVKRFLARHAIGLEMAHPASRNWKGYWQRRKSEMVLAPAVGAALAPAPMLPEYDCHGDDEANINHADCFTM